MTQEDVAQAKKAVAEAFAEASTKAGEDGWRAEANASGFVAALSAYDDWRIILQLKEYGDRPTAWSSFKAIFGK